MDTIILNIYTDTAKSEIFEFLKKFKSQEAEIQPKTVAAISVINKIAAHPFFGMINDAQETVEETMSRLRGSRY